MRATSTRRQFIHRASVGGLAGAAALASPLVSGATSSTPAATRANANAETARAPADAAAEPQPLVVGGDGKARPAAPFVAPKAVRPLRIADLNDLEAAAAKVMDPGAFAWVASGSDNQWTLGENLRAFDHYVIRPRYLVGKGAPDLSTTLLGHTLSLPIITAPMGAHGVAHASAELGTARGAGEVGTLMTVSTAANRTLEEIAAATKGPKWFQLYLHDDRALSLALLRRAEAAGYTAVILTIDAFAPGSSDATYRLGFSFPPELKLVNSGTAVFKRSLGWDDVSFVQQNTKLPLILKGVLTPELANEAVHKGVAGIQVSNHGGRQLDGVTAAIDALPAVVKAVNGRVPVIMDSGIRRGTDVFKALCLGANAVALGRPLLYALSLGGWMGVRSAYQRLREELARDMMIAGVGSVSEFSSDFVVRRS